MWRQFCNLCSLSLQQLCASQFGQNQWICWDEFDLERDPRKLTNLIHYNLTSPCPISNWRRVLLFKIFLIWEMIEQTTGEQLVRAALRWSGLAKISSLTRLNQAGVATAQNEDQKQTTGSYNHLLPSFTAASHRCWTWQHEEEMKRWDVYQWWKQSAAWDIKTCVKRPPQMGSNTDTSTNTDTSSNTDTSTRH